MERQLIMMINYDIREILISVLAILSGIFGILISVPAYWQGIDCPNYPKSLPITVLVNQVGYDVNGEKIVVGQSQDRLGKQPANGFQLIDKSQKIVFSGKLVHCGRVNNGTRIVSGGFGFTSYDWFNEPNFREMWRERPLTCA